MVNATVTPGPYKPGSDVTFTIEITNQGSLNASNIQISDYIPNGLSLNDAAWTENAGVATLITPIASLATGQTVTREISFTINNDFEGTTIRNWAEISAAENVPNVEDEDSTPDDINFNQPGETDDLSDDGTIDENGKNGGDEDDHDPAEIEVEQTFDLALRKTESSSGPYMPGGSVTFTIEIFNQGTLAATDIQISDYIPEPD